MNYKEHLIGGIILGVGAVYLTHKMAIPCNSVVLVSTASLGALLPDIDHPKSKVGRVVPFLSRPLYKWVGHRTLTHSLAFATLTASVGLQLHAAFGIGLFVGVISHILLDMFTPAGVSLLYPFRKNKFRLLKLYAPK